ncbi:MAG: transcriptional regulator [Phycisphaeraceae bacterium]
MSEKYGRIHRLLRILTLIQAETGWNAKRLADECGTTERTIYRDFEMLEGAGIPYYYDEQTKGYRVRRDFFMPPVELTLDESLALIMLAGQVGEKDQIPFTRAAGRVVAKVKSRLPEKVRRELGELDRHIEIQLAKASSEDGIRDVYDHVCNAIATRRALMCSYESIANRESSDAGEEVFQFDPYRLYFDQRAWYTLGYHHGRGEVRCLRLNRFVRVSPTDKAYEIPEDFSLESHLGKAWRMIRGDKTYQVELIFDKEFADTIASTHWHPTQVIEWLEDGGIVFRCEVDGLDEILWWVLSMGPHCVVRQPQELAQRVADLARQMINLYDGKGRMSAK